MKSTTKTILSTAAGAVSWTFMEYGLHRFAMHELKGKGLASREHLTHHADVTYFSPMSKKLLSASASSAVVFPLAWRAIGKRDAAALTGGMVATYGIYEVAHRRVHTHAPINAFGRWMRRSHFHHHFGAPMKNFGVTSPVWDIAFRSYEDPGVITMPRRMAPTWLLDDEGNVKERFAADYVVRGRPRPTTDQQQADRDAAWANRPPQVVTEADQDVTPDERPGPSAARPQPADARSLQAASA